jgi:TolA-binding protein
VIRRALLPIILLSAVATAPVIAQDDNVRLRVDKIERELKAVQRKVFPGGKPVEPEIGPTETGQGGIPSSGPITDLTARVDALENQLRSMTGQVEQNTNRIRKLEDAIKALQSGGATPASSTSATRPDPELPPVTKTAAVTPTPAAVKPAPAKPAPAKPAITAPTAPATKVSTTPAKIDPKRKAAVAAVELPDTGDAAEDAYTYGFRLWTAKLYPEAQVKLKEFVGKYGKHRRASYAQNLLGRAYLDEGKPALASVAFYENYTKNPKGERAPESLYFLGVALTKLEKLPDACKVFAEFGDVYGATAGAELKARVAQGRTNAKCTI